MKRFIVEVLIFLGVTGLFALWSQPASALQWAVEDDIQISTSTSSPNQLETDLVIPRCGLVLTSYGRQTVALCTYAGKAISASIYTNRSLNMDNLYISLAGQARYPVQDTSRSGFHYYLSKQNDVLVVAQEAGGMSGQSSMSVYKDISKKLTKTIGDDSLTYYKLPAPDFTLKMSSGMLASVRHGSLSDNGEHFVTQVDNLGLVRINTTTFDTALFARDQSGAEDYFGRMLGISNDGRSVTMVSKTGQVKVYDIGPICAKPNFDTYVGNKLCKYLDVGGRVTAALGVLGGEPIDAPRLQVPHYTSSKEVVIGPFNNKNLKVTTLYNEDSRITYLALGDSYSSGEGDVDDDGFWYREGTGNRDECHLSSRSYPYLLKGKWGIANDAMKSVACAGARVDPDYFGDSEYFGQKNDLENKPEIESQQLRNDALDNFKPGVIRQIDFVVKYKPEVLTLTAGGNDVGFGDIIGYCATPRASSLSIEGDVSCAQAYDPQVAANLRKTIDDQRGPLTALINKIKELSPTTMVYLIGYPQFIALDGCVSNSGILDSNERRMIRDSVSRLNNIFKLVARDTDVYYVDIEDSLEGGQICQGSRYMTGPVQIASKVLAGYVQEAYHPNANGHAKIADAIDERINNNLNYTIIDIPLEQNGQRVIKRAVTSNYAGVGSEQTIEMGPGIFNEDGTVDLDIFSRKLRLGTYKVANDGSLNVKTTIPLGLEPGIHLLTLTGQSTSGDTVQVQQYITVYSEPTSPDKSHNQTINTQPIHTSGLGTYKVATELKEPNTAQTTNLELDRDELSVSGIDDWTGLVDGRSLDRTQSGTDKFGFYTLVLTSAIIALLGALAIYAKKAQKKAR